MDGEFAERMLASISYCGRLLYLDSADAIPLFVVELFHVECQQ
jgi:hypothetical protein